MFAAAKTLVELVDGARILREIVKATGAEICADSPLTQYFANQAKRDMALEPAEEN